MARILESDRKSEVKSRRKGEPTWDIALAYPRQGLWTEDDYFALEHTLGNRMIELANGFLEFLPMPDFYHQDIVEFLFSALKAYLQEHHFGRAYFAPLPIRLWPGQIREPDIAVFRRGRIKHKRKAGDGADLVMEVVSPGEDARERDLDVKRREYAKAKIPEYWIVDPEPRTITVLALFGKSYKDHGVFTLGQKAASKLLKGFEVDVSDVFAAGEARD
jgi:Uma2 family endonuclease